MAGSVTTLRRLIMNVKRATTGATGSSGIPVGSKQFIPFGVANAPSGQKSRTRTFNNPTDNGISITTINTKRDGDWRRLQDESFDKDDKHGRIRADYTYEVEMTRDPEHQSVGTPSR